MARKKKETDLLLKLDQNFLDSLTLLKDTLLEDNTTVLAGEYVPAGPKATHNSM